MHFPCTNDVRSLVPDSKTLDSIKSLLMPADWRALEELPASHLIAVNLELCKDGREGFLQGSVGRDGSGVVGSSDGLTIPAEVLREARARWALEDSAASENNQNGSNIGSGATSPTKRSSRFMDFVSAWRAVNDDGTAVRAIRASELLLGWVKAIVKCRVLLTTVYAGDGLEGTGAGAGEGDYDDSGNAISILKAFDAAVAREHSAAKIYTEVWDVAKKIDEAER